MIVRVTADRSVVLDEPGLLTRLHVEAATGVEVGPALAAAGAGGSLDGDHVEIDLAWLRAAAAGHASVADLDALVGYAASRGWVSADGERVRAHVVR
jgi:hypothetical protein